jgi:hypothetical protein
MCTTETPGDVENNTNHIRRKKQTAKQQIRLLLEDQRDTTRITLAELCFFCQIERTALFSFLKEQLSSASNAKRQNASKRGVSLYANT